MSDFAEKVHNSKIDNIPVEKRPVGRPKGSKAKIGTDVKKAIFKTFQELGGEDYLAVVATEHPAVFCNLLAKLVPAEMRAEIGRAGDFDHLSDEELDIAIRNKYVELGFATGGKGTETLHVESDPVHEENPSKLLPCETPSPDSGSLREGSKG